MKKRFLAALLALTMLFALCLPAAAADIRTVYTSITYREIKIVINGVLISPCDETGASTEPFIYNDTTYLPVRAIAGALGLKVGWDASTSTVVLERGGEQLLGTPQPPAPAMSMDAAITYRGTKISLDGENIPLINRNGDSVEPFIYKGSNYLPLRVVGEALGLSVDWNGVTNTVTITGSIDGEEEEEIPVSKPETLMLPVLIELSSDRYCATGKYEPSFNLAFEYDELGRISRIYTDNGQADFRIAYDDGGRLALLSVEGLKYGNKSYRWEYDEAGECVARFDITGLYDGYIPHYDEQGRLVKEEFSEDGDYSAITYKYNDADNSVSLEKFHGIEKVSSWVNYYNDKSQLIRTEEAGDTTYFEYDDKGMLVYKKIVEAEEDGFIPWVEEYRYSYNEAGALVREEMKYENEDYISTIITYEYNSDGSPSYIKEVDNVNMGYTDSRGNEILVLVEGAYIKECFYTYDSRGVLTKYEEKNGGNSYNPRNGKITYSQSDVRYVESYVYDSEGRLLKRFEKQEGSVMNEYFFEDVWTYDEEGRAILHTRTETKENFTYPRVVKHSWSYDEKGRLTSDVVEDRGHYALSGGGWYCKYDKYDRLVEYSQTDVNGWILTEKYNYDALGHLVGYEMSENGVKTSVEIIYDEAGNPVKLIGTSGNDSIMGEISSVEVPYTETNFQLFRELRNFN